MSEFIYKDYLPANARVIIDYTKDQKVKFSYPLEWTYRKAVIKRAFPTVFTFWLSIHYAIAALIGMIFFVPSIIIIIVISIVGYQVHNPATIKYYDFIHFGLPYFLFLFYVVGIPILITLWLSINKDRMSKWLPKFGYWTAWSFGILKQKTFTVNDLIENKAIISVFDNMFLNYEATGDFNDKLTKIEILELPFNYIKQGFLTSSKKQVNDFKFRAVFYFSEQPTNGSLDVVFG